MRLEAGSPKIMSRLRPRKARKKQQSEWRDTCWIESLCSLRILCGVFTVKYPARIVDCELGGLRVFSFLFCRTFHFS